MKKLISWLAAASLCCALTGCFESGIYNIMDRFRFRVHSDWGLSQAEYDEETGKSRRLNFNGISVGELGYYIPAKIEAAHYGDGEVRQIESCPYEAWEFIGEPYQNWRDETVVESVTWIEAEGYVLRIGGEVRQDSLKDYERDLSALTDSVEFIGKPREFAPGAADAGKIHLAWTGDWQNDGGIEGLNNFQLSAAKPMTWDESYTALMIYEMTDADYSPDEVIATRADKDGKETEANLISVEHIAADSFCGLPVQDALRTRLTSKAEGTSTVTETYYTEIGGTHYEINFMYHDSGDFDIEKYAQGLKLIAIAS